MTTNRSAAKRPYAPFDRLTFLAGEKWVEFADTKIETLDFKLLHSDYKDLFAEFKQAQTIDTNDKPASVVTATQEWEGYVLTVESDIFTARLLDITAGSPVEQEEAEIPIEDVSQDDRDLLKEGAVFRWVIGNQITRGGQKRRVSQIIFRRLPAWTETEIEEAKRVAETTSQAIHWE